MSKQDDDDFEDEFENLDEDWEGEDFEMSFPTMGPIDKKFYPFDSEDPFGSCTMCQTEFEEHSNYLIEKAIKGTDVIFELAMCIPCAEQMRNQLSEDSRERIELYMSQVNFEKRAQDAMESESQNIEDYIGKCIVSGFEIDPDEEHQIYAFCIGKEMVYGAMPYAISGVVMEEVQELLSPETKQEMDDFMDQYLIPDDLRDLLKGRPVFV